MQELAVEFKNVEKSFMHKEIFKIEDLKVYQNEKIGIIGKNGQGKTTLLDIIDGCISPDKGKINKMIEFNYYRQIENQITLHPELTDPILLGKLQVPNHTISGFSGGEQTRLRLANFFSTYQMGILMDEPTSHLDKEGIEFLIEELRHYYGTLIVVSHDRLFLDKVVEKIWEIEDGKVTVYEGNFSKYQDQKAYERKTQKNAYEQYIKEKNRLEKAAWHKKEQARKMSRVTQKQKKRNIQPSRLAASKQKDTVVKSIHKTAKSIQERSIQLQPVDKVEKEKTLKFNQPKTLMMHNDFPIRGENVTIKKGNKLLLEKINFQFPKGKRIGITGPNGSGKTSLLKHVISRGDGITVSSKVAFSVYQQMDYKYSREKNVLSFLSEDSDFSQTVIRSVLHNLGFSSLDMLKFINDLSGGEITRLMIAKLFTVPSNVLVLDEPTNFIDIKTIEALEYLMSNYKGTILFTSHDEYFIENMAEQLWEIRDRSLILK